MVVSLSGVEGGNGRRISSVVDGFLLKCKVEGLQKQTIDDHRRKLGRFISYCGDCCIDNVNREIVKGFLDDVKERYRLELMTVQRHLVSMKAFFN